MFYSLCYATFRRKRKPKLFRFKNVMEGERKILTCIKKFLENNTEALVISKSLKFP